MHVYRNDINTRWPVDILPSFPSSDAQTKLSFDENATINIADVVAIDAGEADDAPVNGGRRRDSGRIRLDCEDWDG